MICFPEEKEQQTGWSPKQLYVIVFVVCLVFVCVCGVVVLFGWFAPLGKQMQCKSRKMEKIDTS